MSVGIADVHTTGLRAGLAYVLAFGIAVATAFLTTWIDLAVGFTGGEDNPANARLRRRAG